MPSTDTEFAAVKAAICPDFHSRSAYVGRVAQTEEITIIGEDGTPYEVRVSFLISWDTIKKILTMAQDRAGLPIKH